jgi:thioesterase domain-containing protein
VQLSDWQRVINEQIPSAAAMRPILTSVGPDRVSLNAPLASNLNPHGTAFGGSQVSLCTLAGWLCVRSLLLERAPDAELVIHRSRIKYLHPVREDFAVHGVMTSIASEQFLDRLLARHTASVRVDVHVIAHGHICAEFIGHYVGKTNFRDVQTSGS